MKLFYREIEPETSPKEEEGEEEEEEENLEK